MPPTSLSWRTSRSSATRRTTTPAITSTAGCIATRAGAANIMPCTPGRSGCERGSIWGWMPSTATARSRFCPCSGLRQPSYSSASSGAGRGWMDAGARVRASSRGTAEAGRRAGGDHWEEELRALLGAMLFSATLFLSGTRLFVDPPAHAGAAGLVCRSCPWLLHRRESSGRLLLHPLLPGHQRDGGEVRESAANPLGRWRSCHSINSTIFQM